MTHGYVSEHFRKSFISRLAFIAAIVIIGLAALSRTGQSATLIIINSTADVVADDGDCTLREAIIAANTDSALYVTPGECPAGSGADTIQLDALIYPLSTGGAGEDDAYTGDLDILEDLTILGAGMGSTIINGGGTALGDAWVFSIINNVTFVIDSLTVTGFEGQYVFYHVTGNSELDFIGCAVSNNDSSGIFSNDTLTLNVEDSSFLNNNSPSDGGAIKVFDGHTVINRSSFINNRTGADNDGGAIYASGSGSIAITNSTFSDNRAEGHGGALYLGKYSYLYNVTIFKNYSDFDTDGIGDGGGVYKPILPSILVIVSNSIIASNIDLGSPIEHDCWGSFLSSSYNLIGRDTAGCTGFPNGVGDQVGTVASPIDPKLEALLYNGGLMGIYALQPGSPAIDAGDPSGCESYSSVAILTDQRGWNRHVDGDRDGNAICDIGAYEYPSHLYLPLIMR